MDGSRITQLTSYLNDYAPLIKDLAHEPLPDKLHSECVEMLKLKAEYDRDPQSFVSSHQYDIFAFMRAYKTLQDLGEPFAAKLKVKTVDDVMQSTKTEDWSPVIRDLGLLNTLHRAELKNPHNKKQPLAATSARTAGGITSESMTKNDIQEINASLAKRHWLLNVRLNGITFMDGKNLEFAVKGKPIWIYADGKMVGPKGAPRLQFLQYLKHS